MEQSSRIPLARPTKGSAVRTLLPILALVGLAWLFVVAEPVGMNAGPALFIAAWTIMMVAMMLPSAAPLVLLHRRGSSAGQTASLTAGYLIVWALAGIPAYAAQLLVMSLAGDPMMPMDMPMPDMPMTGTSMSDIPLTRMQTMISVVALAAAGLYQLTPLKTACLKHCRTPADFLMQRWGRGPFRLGLEHGAWCLGCCWALMAVLVLVGMMGLAWVVGIAVLVAAEKIAPRGLVWARVSGVALLVAAVYQGIR
jgi:predicted metal-binding membrane protein